MNLTQREFNQLNLRELHQLKATLKNKQTEKYVVPSRTDTQTAPRRFSALEILEMKQ